MIQATAKTTATLGTLVKDYAIYNAWAKRRGRVMAKQSMIEQLQKAA